MYKNDALCKNSKIFTTFVQKMQNLYEGTVPNRFGIYVG